MYVNQIHVDFVEFVLKKFVYYVLEELNVKSIVPCNDPLKYASLRTEPEFSVLGKRLGKSMPVVAKEVKAMSQEDILAFEKSGESTVAAHSLKLTDIKLMRLGRAEPEAATIRNKFLVKLEIEDSLDEEHGPLNKQSKCSSPFNEV
ncbi:Isoleucine--tRNA ligase, cytoplasmic [Camellia lanceoleosa]|uniref:Isoleucine--tRNA ligase, cytoplasmic n=1 Tax=Camellia lanceoleosa TaxID=1840588 RepID=A0ACC0HWE8_9ERIC|nr:Isoleucine--tRNA ligase, cytoplasmic [Camellia lanceoleosa]